MSGPATGTNAAHGTDPTDLPTLDELELADRRVLVRVDINSPIEDGQPVPNPRLRAAAETVEALLDRGAGVVILAHQGRPGRADFTGLEHHAELIGQTIGREVGFTPHVDDDEALAAVQKVQPGDALLLDNVRSAQGEIENVPAETHAERQWVRRLAGEAEAFVLDAFPACHRSHATIVGFPLLLPAGAGPLLTEELEAIEHATSEVEGERILVLGGAKVEDALKVLHHHLEGGLIDQALCGGLMGELFLQARGHDLGAATDRVLERVGASGFFSLAESLVLTYDPQIVTPLDVAYTDGGKRQDIFIEELPAKGKLLDIGPATAEDFAERIGGADSIVVNGPMGAYEQAGFSLGTEQMLEACARTQGYTLLGGGHTVTSMEHFGYEPGEFGHVSLAGGALITYLTGDPLPGLEALRESARKFALSPDTA